MKTLLEPGYLYPLLSGGFFCPTSNDLATNTITGKYFDTVEEWDDFIHERSLQQMPKWHLNECPRCADEKKGARK